jgi:hypothetical protein
MSEAPSMQGRSFWLKAALLALPAVAALATFSLARPPAEPAQGAAADAQASRFMGTALCQSCHGVADNPVYPKSKGHILLNEYLTWHDKDKHRLAFNMLTGERGAAMAKRLGADVTKSETGCLGCHSASKQEVLSQGDNFNRADGVSCENCHGPASRWLGEHLDTSWRTKSVDQKSKLGMTDLRDPELQAAKCLSCHIGNEAEGKVVTHTMYAVGHPPLPSIEIASFGDQIPRHWWLKAEKPENKAAYETGALVELERSKLALVSAAVALKTSMTLVADESKVSEGPTPGLAWPDYARFDCTSCHHELERPSWRQERGYTGAPGRPQVVRWPLFMVALGVEKLAMEDPAAAGLRDELKAQEAAFSEATRLKPFGRSNDVGAAAAKYAAWAGSLASRLNKSKFDKKTVAELLRRLVTEASETDLDYDAARHVAWTLWAFYQDLGPDPANKDAIEPILKKIATGLRLELPATQSRKIEDQLADALRTMGEYKPAVLREDLKALAPLLSR